MRTCLLLLAVAAALSACSDPRVAETDRVDMCINAATREVRLVYKFAGEPRDRDCGDGRPNKWPPGLAARQAQ